MRRRNTRDPAWPVGSDGDQRAMAYDHLDHTGNRGDLIKHFALTMAVRELAEASGRFSYVDVHAGRGQYDLRGTDAWEAGVGAFEKRCRGRKYLSEDVRYFFQVQSIADVRRSARYWGSPRIVRNVLDDLAVPNIEMALCDSNAVVCEHLRTQFRDMAAATIWCGDGYSMARAVDAPDLVFIDPPDLRDHHQLLLELMRHCVAEAKPFVSWNPLYGDAPGQDMSTECLAVRCFALQRGIPSVTVRWADRWTAAMCGCQMLFSLPPGKEVAGACQSLAAFMGWTSTRG